MASVDNIGINNNFVAKEAKINDKPSTNIQQVEEQQEGVSLLDSKASQAIANSYRPINIQKPINTIIKTGIPGQKVLITSDFKNPEKVIVTFFNDGHPTKPFTTDVNSLSDYGLSLPE